MRRHFAQRSECNLTGPQARDTSNVGRRGLPERPRRAGRERRVTADDCKALAEVVVVVSILPVCPAACRRFLLTVIVAHIFVRQALRPLVGRASSWTSQVAGEWCQAVTAAERDAGTAGFGAGRADWHRFPKDREQSMWTRVPGPGGAGPAVHSGRSAHSAPGGWPVQGESQLAVRSPEWTFGAITQSSPFPGGDNVVSVVFTSNVPLAPSQVTHPLTIPERHS